MSFNTSTGVYTAATGATTATAGQTIASATWNSIFTDLATALSQVGQGFKTAPVTYTAASNSLGTGDCSVIINATISSTVTFQAAASYIGRSITIKSTGTGAVTSATANVVPLAGGAASTSLLSGAGKWACVQSDGTNWVIMAAN